MAELVSSLLSALGRRIRDPSNLAHTSTYVIPLMSHCQRCVNAMTGALKTTTSLTLPATSPTVFTDMLVSLPSLVRVERMLYQGEDVYRQPWTTFYQDNPYWARASGPRPLAWDMIGRGILAITPVVLGGGESVSCIGTSLTTTLVSANSTTELPDEHMPTILAMMEQLLLQRQRLMASVKPSIEHFERALPSAIP